MAMPTRNKNLWGDRALLPFLPSCYPVNSQRYRLSAATGNLWNHLYPNTAVRRPPRYSPRNQGGRRGSDL